MVRAVTLAGLIFSTTLALIAYCLHLNPGALDWRRARQPLLTTTAPPRPAPIAFVKDLAATWSPPETFQFYRGSLTRDGVSSETITAPRAIRWASESFNVGIHGASKSSPAVDDSGVYVGSDSGWIRAFALDGTPRWSFKVAGAARGIHSTPLLSKHRVYIGSYGGTFYVLNKADGALVWTFHVDGTAFGSSPLALDDKLIAVMETETRDAFVVALDARDGHVIWQSEFLGEQIHSSPAIDRESGLIVVGANNKTLFGIDAADGRVAWRRFLGGEVKGTPLLADGVAYVSSWAAKLHAVEIKTGRVLWEAPLLGLSQSSPTRAPGGDVLVVGGADGIVGVDRRTHRAAWRLKTYYRVMSSALLAKDQRGRWLAWIACGKDALCALEPTTGRVAQKLPLPGTLTGVPVAHGGSLFLALDYPGGLIRL